MKRQLGPFDGLSPIRHREVYDSRTRIQESIEILYIDEQASNESVRARRLNFYRPPRQSPVLRRRDLPELLQQLYVKKVRFGLQLIKQYFLFSESYSSLHSNYRYLRETVQYGCEALEDLLASQNQKAKVMAFEYIRVRSAGKNCSTHYESNPSLEQIHRLTLLTTTIEKVFQQLTRRTIEDFYQRITMFADRQKSKILMPVPLVNVDDGAETARRRSTQSVATGKVSSYAQSEQIESKQYIYIFKTKSKMTSEQLSRKKSTFIKVPLLSNNIEINEISLMNNTPQLGEQKPKYDYTKHKRHASNRYYMRKEHKHYACTSCRYCSTFRELNALWVQRDFSKKKLSMARLPYPRSYRKR